jgi:DNA-binding NarL/FixJ family response regulator
LFISRKTASVHASHIFDKLGAANRIDAAGIARRLGIDAGPPPPGARS